ncbi:MULTISPECIES: hypothetical protein [unclassified Pseudomonas]|uniref:hypothetical protein n=1 Tax=unclassified Pseudomonas TaxID=196821 RepID=UPI0021152FD5|nr:MULTISPECIES: hypothetical protein [unclassified Pseudomonas]
MLNAGQMAEQDRQQDRGQGFQFVDQAATVAAELAEISRQIAQQLPEFRQRLGRGHGSMMIAVVSA